MFEKNLSFLGVTGLEDALQWNAPQTLGRLKNSGIKVWICTGDKYHTTVNVARSLKLIKKIGDAERSVDINTSKKEEISEILTTALAAMESKGEKHVIEYVAISGISLALIFGNQQLEAAML